MKLFQFMKSLKKHLMLLGKMVLYMLLIVRATADDGAGLAGDPKLNIFMEQLLRIAHLAGDPKRKG